MEIATSKDRTTIVYGQVGAGPAVILVGGTNFATTERGEKEHVL